MTDIKRSCRRVVSIGLPVLLSIIMFVSPARALLFDDDLPKETKARNLNLLAAGVTLAWGVVNWDYFQKSPRANSEGWFGRDTDEGGADKLGHLYSTYVLSHVYASLYQKWDYPEERAQGLGALSALGTMTLVELGDSFSDYGLSYEDMVMNCVGAVAGYWLGSHSEWQRVVDLRLEYAPSLRNFEADVATDYEHHKYLVAIKAEGFDSLRDTLLGYLELHAGYYARGYDDYHPGQGDDDRERTVYVGLGLNVGKLIENIWETRVFNYLQLPYTYLPLKHDLD